MPSTVLDVYLGPSTHAYVTQFSSVHIATAHTEVFLRRDTTVSAADHAAALAQIAAACTAEARRLMGQVAA